MSTPHIDYAEKPPVHQRWISGKRLAWIAVFIFAASGAWWLPAGLRHAELLYWQQECIDYLAPADELVYDRSRSIQLVPPAWSHFYSIFSPPGFQSEATVFMHELKKEDGEKRLVVVDFVPGVNGNLVQHSRVFVPGSPGRLPEEITRRSNAPLLQFDQEGTLLFSGHVDPVNPNHFTFRVQEGKKQSLYEGWLQSNETVLIGEEKLPHL